MAKYWVKSFFTILLLLLILGIYFGFTYGVAFTTLSNGNIIVGILFVLLIMGLLTFILSKILNFISYRNGFIYWLFAFIYSIIILIMSLNHYLNIDGHPFIGSLTYHMSITFFLIPELNGRWDSYLNKETKFIGDKVVSYREWVSDEYTPGWWQKFIAQLIFSVIAALVYTYGNNTLIWIIFAVEGLWSGSFLLTNFKYKFL